MRRTIRSTALVVTLASSSAFASNTWQDEAMDAWIDGKAEATLMLNSDLDSFDVNTDVENGKVLLTGKVDNDIEKELAEELISGIEGVKAVDNKLAVVNQHANQDSFLFTDTKISAVIKSRLLFDSEVTGSEIDVSVDKRVVTLDGFVDSDAERTLAVTIASNTNDVASVTDKLKVKSDSE